MKEAIDFFCGAGGASAGLVSSKHIEVVAAINHNPDAVKCHAQNHPNTKHFNHDIREINAEQLYQEFPDTSVFWWSAECTHISNAKGGDPRDANSRMLNYELIRFMEKFKNLEYVFIENVREFETWGALKQKAINLAASLKAQKEEILKIGKKGYFIDKNFLIWKDEQFTNPYMIADRERAGEYHLNWINQIKELGFEYDYRILNAADFGAYTKRTRYWGIVTKKGVKAIWPRKTHTKNPPPPSLLYAKPLKKWKPVRDLLDLDDMGESIFTREQRGKKPLASNTIERIEYGLNKYFGDKDNPFVIRYPYAGENVSHLPVVEQINVEGEYKAFIKKWYGMGGETSLDDPLHTITTKDRFSLVGCLFLNNCKRGKYSETVKIVQFLEKMFTGKENVQSIDEPMHTIMPVPKQRLISGLIVDTRIVDIKMRMLYVHELLQAQGFPKNYIMPKAATKAKFFIGNSVPPVMAKLLSHCQFGTDEQRIQGVENYFQTVV